MAIERRVVGPPGTGKTTFVARQVAACVERWGSRGVVVASLTNAAAKEAAGRVTNIDKNQVGTLHGHAFAAIGHPEMAIAAIEDWNENCPFGLTLSKDQKTSPIEEPTSKTPGDELHLEYQIYRAKMIDREIWPYHVKGFAEPWEKWKAELGVMDFTDLIERALEDTTCAPGMPQALLIDEAQDCSALEVALVRKWGEMAEEVFFIGDADQAIFDWRGGDASHLASGEIPPERHKVLSQSYRVPRAIHALSQAWIRRLPDREDAEYRPRDADGEVRRSHATWKTPWDICAEVERALDTHESVMLLASCNYMLAPTITELRARGLPFWNPYRPEAGNWNPLQRSTEKRISSVDRVLAYLRPDEEVWGDEARMWSWEDTRVWASALRTDQKKKPGALKRGAKAVLDSKDGEASISDLLEHVLVDEDAMTAAFAGDLDWYQRNLLKDRAGGLAFPIEIVRRRGGAMLRERPRLTVGTVHSVKGGEASCVIVIPDASPQAWKGWTTGNKGPLTRLFYVAVTRARGSVVICRGVGTVKVPI